MIGFISGFSGLTVLASVMIGIGQEFPYPTNWPAIVNNAKEDCSLISGEYENTGQSEIPDSYGKFIEQPGSFSELPWVGISSKQDNPTSFNLVYDTNTKIFNIEYLSSNKKYSSLMFPNSNNSNQIKQNLVCDNGQLIIETETSGYGDGSSTNTKYYIALMKAVNGSLIVLYNIVNETTDLFIFKSEYKNFQWYQFQSHSPL